MNIEQMVRHAVQDHVRSEAGIAPSEGTRIRVDVNHVREGEYGWTAMARTDAHTDKTYLVSHNERNGVTIVNEYTQSSSSSSQLPPAAKDDAILTSPKLDYVAPVDSNVNTSGSYGYQIGDKNTQVNHF